MHRLFIIDDQISFDVSNQGGTSVVRSKSELDKIIKSTVFEHIIILAELAWENTKPHWFHGFEVAKDLRVQHKLLCPIIMCSKQSREYFQNSNDLNFHFFNSPGLYFLSMDDMGTLDDVLEVAQSIDEETSLDIAETFGGLQGFIADVIHDLKNVCLGLALPITSVPPEIRAHFEQLRSFFPRKESEISLIEVSFVKALGSATEQQIVTQTIDKLNNELTELLPIEPTEENPRQYTAKWKIVFLDDEEQIRKFVKEKFEKRGLKCDVSANVEELYLLLKKDEQYNYYTVCICDYRLKEGNHKKFSQKQGYTVLKEIFVDKPNYLSLFALSSMDTGVLLKLRERYQMEVWTFSKDDIKVDAGFNIFCAKVFEEGERMFETVCNLPGDDFSAWKTADKNKRVQPFNEFYRSFRMSDDFEKEEKRIGNEALALFRDRISYKNDNNGITPHPYEFSSGLTKGKHDENDMRKFKEKLIGRRAYLAFRFKGKIYDSAKVAALLSKDPRKSVPQTSFFPSHLCMPEDFDRMPILLQEERYWLKQKLSFDVNSINRSTYNEILDVLLDGWDSEVDSLEEVRNILEATQKDANWRTLQNKFKKKVQDFFNQNLNEEKFAELRNRFAISGVYGVLREFGITPTGERFAKESNEFAEEEEPDHSPSEEHHNPSYFESDKHLDGDDE